MARGRRKMQIGAFVREMGTTADTVRYYMELSLLAPELKGKRYSFGEKEVRDFQAIAQLKQWGFAVKEIQCLFGHKAQSGCGTAEVLRFARDMLQERVHAIDSSIAELGRQREGVLVNLAEVEAVLGRVE
ncbi:MerR family transcriptional regulator [Paenibacillus sp. LMG 31459]|uniref:MerR family transcriptional regulator n=2 Tax=Paenibacillus TaxID=44249 RepID=A0ABX1YB92_9BACL|nr:MerR family transcriptional regulator [Paenibacillus phytohabitans]